MLRVAGLWLPRLAIERWSKDRPRDCAPDEPVVLIVEAAHGPVIHAVSDAAADRGARAGTRLTDARAVDPALAALPADPDGDLALLQRLARWATRWSPLVEVDGGDGLRLDVSGVAHLFGGERGLVRDMEAKFAALGLTARVAIAPTAAAAWALARYGRDPRICRKQDVAAALASLPVAALRLDPRSVRTLERLGLKTVGALAGIERRSLARRFREADNPLDALDRALGRKPEPLTAAQFEPPPRATLRLREPVADPAAASQAVDLLVPKLVVELERRKLGARRLALSGFRVDGSVGTASVATSIPSREPKHLARLLAGAMEKAGSALDPGFGFDGFALEASWSEPLGAAQESLVEDPGGEGDIARLIDRLSVKLGPGNVRRPRPLQSHVPERASGWNAAIAKADSAPPRPPGIGQRPERLLDRPEAIAVIYATPEGVPRRFVWRKAVHDIARVEGPERIAPEWWRERSTARLRDYYRVEDGEGRRYWIFREGLIDDGRGGLPLWYLHGLFG